MTTRIYISPVIGSGRSIDDPLRPAVAAENVRWARIAGDGTSVAVAVFASDKKQSELSAAYDVAMPADIAAARSAQAVMRGKLIAADRMEVAQ